MWEVLAIFGLIGLWFVFLGWSHWRQRSLLASSPQKVATFLTSFPVSELRALSPSEQSSRSYADREAMAQGHSLPPGKTCRDCVHSHVCTQLGCVKDLTAHVCALPIYDFLEVAL